MKKSINFKNDSTEEFAKDRETVRIVTKNPTVKPIKFRNYLSYNVKDPKSYSLGTKN